MRNNSLESRIGRRPAAPAAIWVCAAMLIAGLMTSCSTDRDPESFFAPQDVGKLVVDTLLINGKALPQITVTRALSPSVAYSLDAAGEPNAIVQVQQWPSGLVFQYDATSQVGVYAPQSNVVVLPNTLYSLRVVTAAGEVVTASTQTPPALDISQWLLLDATGENIRQQLATYDELGDNVYFAPENQLTYADGLLEARFPRPDVLGFQIGIFSLDLDSDFVIEPDFFDPEDFESLERQGSSPALEVPEGDLRLPWFAIFFEGRYKIRVMALDRNSVDWVRSLPQEGGFNFGGTIGDNFERPIFHVEGGIGLFGSASADSIGFFVRKRPELSLKANATASNAQGRRLF